MVMLGSDGIGFRDKNKRFCTLSVTPSSFGRSTVSTTIKLRQMNITNVREMYRGSKIGC